MLCESLQKLLFDNHKTAANLLKRRLSRLSIRSLETSCGDSLAIIGMSPHGPELRFEADLMDTLTKEQRRKTMRAVKSKDSKIEVRLRRALWQRGHRYRKHYGKLIGKPDIVFTSLRVAIFCDSNFWHGYDWENRKHDFKSNREFWHAKIERNMARDKEVTEALEAQGWTVLRFWGHEIKNELDKCVSRVEEAIAKK